LHKLLKKYGIGLEVEQAKAQMWLGLSFITIDQEEGKCGRRVFRVWQ